MRLVFLFSSCLASIHLGNALPAQLKVTSSAVPSTNSRNATNDTPITTTSTSSAAQAIDAGDFWVSCPHFRLTQENDPRYICGQCADGHGKSINSYLDLGQCLANVDGELAIGANGQFDKTCRQCKMRGSNHERRSNIPADAHILTCLCTPDENKWTEIDLGTVIRNEGGILSCLGFRGVTKKECPGWTVVCDFTMCNTCHGWTCWGNHQSLYYHRK